VGTSVKRGRPSAGEGEAERRADERRLAELRAEIDRLDGEILRLFNERLERARAVGAVKRRLGLPVRDMRREAEIFRRLAELNRGRLLADRHLVRVFAALMAAAREVQSDGAHPADGFGTPALFAVFGNPVVHSLSPVMHNAAFAATGYPGMYAAIRAKDIRPAMAGVRALGFRGASITIPHKEAVLACLDFIDPRARRIGAVNTVVNDAGELKGFNTDWEGIVRALGERVALAGRRVAVLGAGGAARAAVFGARHEGARVTVYNRTRDKGEALAVALGAEFRPLEEFDPADCEILIQATPVGMSPRTAETPLPAERLRPGLVVMDIVYTPLKTRLLSEAEAAGCMTVDGLSMFLYQGARQFELWTGLEAPLDIMRLAVETELTARG